jgi:uncharacterized membrane protein YphA (DoxX/SURF4 family)
MNTDSLGLGQELWEIWRVRLAAAVLGAMFLAAGILKARDVGGFYHDLQSYRLFSPELLLLVAYYGPALEIIAGAAVLFERSRRAGAALLVVMLAGFIMLLTVSWMRGLDISCGCFGPDGGKTNYPLRLGEDVVLLTLAVWVFQWSADTGDVAPPLL